MTEVERAELIALREEMREWHRTTNALLDRSLADLQQTHIWIAAHDARLAASKDRDEGMRPLTRRDLAIFTGSVLALLTVLHFLNIIV